MAMCSASRHVGGAAPAACNQARIEASAVVPSHCRIAARSADGTAHTVRTGCGIADPGLHQSHITGRVAAACQP